MTAAHRRHGIAGFLHRAEAGTAAGLLAAVTVAMLYFLEGALRLHPLSVPAALASGLFGGVGSGPRALGPGGSFVVLGVELLEILGYTVLHLLAFAAVGAVAAFVLDVSTMWTGALGGAAFAGVAGTGLMYMVRWAVGTPVALDVLGLPGVLLTNALAGAVIGISLYLTEHHDPRGAAA
jgi:hypothetical protein